MRVREEHVAPRTCRGPREGVLEVYDADTEIIRGDDALRFNFYEGITGLGVVEEAGELKGYGCSYASDSNGLE